MIPIESSLAQVGRVCWNELVTTDVAAAKCFYSRLFGSATDPFGGGTVYTLLKTGDATVGGLMKCPQPGVPAHWLPGRERAA
jgi:uncharacterized protein